MGHVTIKPIIMHWRSRPDGKAPVAIRTTVNRTPRYSPVRHNGDVLYLSKKEFRNASANASDAVSQQHLAIIQEAVKAATKEFMAKTKPETKSKTLYACFREKVGQLRKDGSSFSTIQLYFAALESFVKFAGKDATADMFTNEEIKNYERKMLNDGYSSTTISIYVRNLAAAIRSVGETPAFTRKVAAKSKRGKMGLTKDVVLKILGYTSDDPKRQWARDMFVFSYLNGGMNTKDIALLRWSDILPDRIEFSRAKRRGDEPVVVTHPIVDMTRDIISRHGVRSSKFVFGVLTGEEDEKRVRTITNQFTKVINKHFARVCADLGIDRATTYSARHSFATILKRQGVDIALISEQLGHSSVTTTRHYLDSFEIEQKKEVTKLLL